MREILVVIFSIISIYFAVATHKIHCILFSKISSKKCPPHICFIMLSFLFFGITIYISQEKYFKSLFDRLNGVAQSGGRIVMAGTNLVQNAAGNFDSLDDFADTVESMAEGIMA